jgi:hypothetical protein
MINGSSYNIVVKIGFGLVGLLALSVLVGWLINVSALYQLADGLPPMQFNNAICFLLLSAGGLL